VTQRQPPPRPSPGDEQVLAEWSIKGLMAATLLALAVIGLLILAAVVDRSSGTPTALGIVAVAVIGLISFRAVRKLGRGHCTLTRSEVRATSARGKECRIPLDQVTAVAVVRAPPGWAIFLWSNGAPPLRLLTPSRVFAWKWQSNAEPTSNYWDKVAASPSGMAAAQIYRQAQMSQPAGGALASTKACDLISTDPVLFRGRHVRWWSPDGEHGH
jgi:hypothetical protein